MINKKFNQVFLAIACLGLAKAPKVTFQDSAGQAYCQAVVGVDLLGDDNDLRKALSRGLGGMPVIESPQEDGTQFALKALENGEYVCEVNLEERVGLKFQMHHITTAEGCDFKLALESYDFYTATSIFSRADNAYFAQIVEASMEVFVRHGVGENQAKEMRAFAERARESAAVDKGVTLGEFPVQTYIAICNDLKRLGFVPACS